MEEKSEFERRSDHLRTPVGPHPLFGVQPGVYDFLPESGGYTRSQYMRFRIGFIKQKDERPLNERMEGMSSDYHPLTRLIRDEVSGPTYKTLAHAERDFIQKLLIKKSHRWKFNADEFWGLGSDLSPNWQWYLPYQRINQCMSDVPRTCRRGWPTAMILSPYMLKILIQSNANRLKLSPVPDIIPGSIFTPLGQYYGKHDRDGIGLFCCSEWPDDSPVVTGYRGKSDADAGIFLIKYKDGYGLEYPDDSHGTHWIPAWSDYFSTVLVNPHEPTFIEMIRMAQSPR